MRKLLFFTLLFISSALFGLSIIHGVYSVVFSADGKHVISSSYEIKIFPYNSSGSVRTIHLDKRNFIKKIRITQDNKYLITSHLNSEITVIDYKTGKTIKILKDFVESVQDFDISKDGKYLAAINRIGIICIYNIANWKKISEKRVNAYDIVRIAISPDNQTIAATTYNNTITILNFSDLQPKFVLKGHSDTIWSLVFSKNGNQLFSAGYDKKLFIWSLTENRLIRNIQLPDISRGISLSPDGRYIAAVTDNNDISLINIQSGRIVKTFKGHDRTPYEVVFSSDGKYIVSGDTGGLVLVHDMNRGTILKKFSH